MNEAPRSLDSLVHAGDVAMLTTIQTDDDITSRPLTVAESDGSGVVFLIDGTDHWAAALHDGDTVSMTVSASGRNDWVAITGRAATSTDHDTIARLWSAPAGVYFDGSDDPRIAALRVSVTHGQYWSAPGGGAIGRLISMVSSALGKETAASAHGPISRD